MIGVRHNGSVFEIHYGNPLTIFVSINPKPWVHHHLTAMPSKLVGTRTQLHRSSNLGIYVSDDFPHIQRIPRNVPSMSGFLSWNPWNQMHWILGIKQIYFYLYGGVGYSAQQDHDMVSSSSGSGTGHTNHLYLLWFIHH